MFCSKLYLAIATLNQWCMKLDLFACSLHNINSLTRILEFQSKIFIVSQTSIFVDIWKWLKIEINHFYPLGDRGRPSVVLIFYCLSQLQFLELLFYIAWWQSPVRAICDFRPKCQPSWIQNGRHLNCKKKNMFYQFFSNL